MKKLCKTANGLDIFARVSFWVMAIGGGIAVLVALAVFIINPELSELAASLTLGPVALELAPGYGIRGWVVRLMFGLGAAFMAMAASLTCVGLHTVRSILAPMKEARPFDGAVHKGLKRLSWLILAGGAAVEVMGATIQSIVLNSSRLNEIFGLPAVTGIEVEYTIDLTFVVVFAVVYLLACVFQYGEELQTQSDETL